MENLYFNLLLLLLLVVAFFTFLIIYKHMSHDKYSNLPPGSLGLPYVGESLSFLIQGWKGHPEKFFNDRKAKFSSETFKTNLFCGPAAMLCGAAGNKFLFSSENKLKPWWPSTVAKIFPLSPDSSPVEEGKRMYALFHQFLKPEALQPYIGVMDTVAQKHFTCEWENKKQVVVFPLALSYSIALSCRYLLSIDDPDRIAIIAKPFKHLASGVFFSMPFNLHGNSTSRAIKAANTVRTQLLTIMRQRKKDLAEEKASPSQDLLSHMLSKCDDNGKYMSEREITNTILGLMMGAHYSPGAACTFIVKYLAELPHIYEGVYQEQIEIAKSKSPGDELLNWNDIQRMKYSWNVAREVLRIAPPFPGSFREAMNDIVFDGFLIPKGWKLFWSSNATHKNPEHFPQPEKFDPTRFDGRGPAPHTYVPFGGGPRICPGREYARFQLLIFMHNLVKRFKFEKLVPNDKIVYSPTPAPTKGLPIRLLPHKLG